MEELDSSYSALTEAVIGAAIEVHRHMGPGFFESAYEEALCEEMDRRASYQRQPAIDLCYKGRVVAESRLDLLIDRKVIVELKAVDRLAAIHESQLLAYLRMTGLRLGLLINFNETTLSRGIRRMVNSRLIDPRSPLRPSALSALSAPLRYKSHPEKDA